MKLKLKMSNRFLENFSNDKEIFDFRNYSTKSNYYDNSNGLVELMFVFSKW